MIKPFMIALALTLSIAVPHAVARPLGEAQDRCMSYGFRDRNNQAACAEIEMRYPAPKHWPLNELMRAQNACLRFGYTGEGQAECIQRRLRSGSGGVPPPASGSSYNTSPSRYNLDRDGPSDHGRGQSQLVDPRAQFDKDGNPNFDTHGNYIGAHGLGATVDNPDVASGDGANNDGTSNSDSTGNDPS